MSLKEKHMAVKIDIGRGPATPDFDGRSRGWRCNLILDPSYKEVTLFRTIGSGWPMSSHYARTLTLSLDSSACLDHATRILESEEVQELLEEIVSLYKGDEWNGSNMVGTWDGDPHYLDMLVSKVEEFIESVDRYQSASDYMSHARQELAMTVKDLSSSMPENKAIRKLASDIVSEVKHDGVLLDVEEFIKEAMNG